MYPMLSKSLGDSHRDLWTCNVAGLRGIRLQTDLPESRSRVWRLSVPAAFATLYVDMTGKRQNLGLTRVS